MGLMKKCFRPIKTLSSRHALSKFCRLSILTTQIRKERGSNNKVFLARFMRFFISPTGSTWLKIILCLSWILTPHL